MIISPASHKPLYLFHLLHTLSISSALCFTKSVEAATRLAKLVEFFEEARVARSEARLLRPSGSSSRRTRPSLRRASATRSCASSRRARCRCASAVLSCHCPCLSDPRDRALTLPLHSRRLICSDLIARGIDIPNVSHVISYDIPADMRKYVHRVGRTARAGNKGDAWSLVEEQEVRLSLPSAPFRLCL